MVTTKWKTYLFPTPNNAICLLTNLFSQISLSHSKYYSSKGWGGVLFFLFVFACIFKQKAISVMKHFLFFLIAPISKCSSLKMSVKGWYSYFHSLSFIRWSRFFDAEFHFCFFLFPFIKYKHITNVTGYPLSSFITYFAFRSLILPSIFDAVQA